ncbi:MAG TPA: 2,3-bisphosphoglycerate-independent phosphoglycerate mutase [Ferrovibrio sp.]|uniref:2,3-bisphosphoglycerate-independent phosphoglycerate mutase n=1 Tax=Ferrovibrio sp. TaxID=1917215 RepID=UPI002B4B12A5|nr:2,3-bisphosphoglycerate-independent phosphoglycerate mutase [Ferrovibrio sp.]HLT76569.1 2,3-bisphosphoglycerate-independent phosphoglycerate mutase [Ferrovibrio sp.]
MTDTAQKRSPVVLCILDGWGLRDDPADNALAQARLPNYRRLLETRPFARVGTSGRDVGLPDGQMGNSEVGHMNIGAGRIAVPDLGRIDNAVADGTLKDNPAITGLTAKLRQSGGALHLMGLLSDGGVHSHQDHMAALANIFAAAGIPVQVHMFADGRDTPPRSALGFLDAFRKAIAAAQGATLATVTGRFYAMDRDKRWERINQAYDALVEARGKTADSAEAAIEQAYAADETDEFITPTVIGSYRGMQDGDGILMANFRADRAREILTALLDPHFDGFARSRVVRFAGAVGITEYSEALNAFLETAYAPVRYPMTLGEVVAKAGRNQLRIAETEKYAHVTFFMNGGEEKPFDGEDRILVPSPKVKTYDLKPEMSAGEVTDRLVEAITSGKYDLVIVNYANPDMVGHTGSMPAAIKAAETIDSCLARLEQAVAGMDGVLLITADHGNLEQMMDRESGQLHTQHTTNPVPLLLVGRRTDGYALQDGRLCDIAPTLLHFLGLPQPAEMTGRCLAQPAGAAPATARRLA